MFKEMTASVDVNGIQAPDFELETFEGHYIRLAGFRRHRHVVLVFNRGFT